MKVKLINHSGVSNNLAENVAYTARVSNIENQHNNLSSDKLIKYLIKHQHWSPFEMLSICMEIETTRDIARQILRHRSFSFQEFSQRYADPTGVLGFAPKEARLQDTKNRQNSIQLDFNDAKDRELNETFRMKQYELIRKVQEIYEWAIKNGIAKEQARAVLPEGLTVSRMYMSGTLRSWIHYIELRSGNGTQLEHRLIAVNCAKAIKPYFPMIEEFVDFNGLEAYNISL